MIQAFSSYLEASFIVTGVFPLPPTMIFPTEIIGIPNSISFDIALFCKNN